MKLSIVVICFNMPREAARTLYTLSSEYQQNVCTKDYEVIVIDNNSLQPLDPEWVKGFGSNFTYHFYRTDSVSPVKAVNFGAGLATGDNIACIVDGARMVTPRIIDYSLQALKLFNKVIVVALAWHLGPKEQNLSMTEGYDQSAEDAMLDTIDWRRDGYLLFDVSTQASSSKVGFLGGIPQESSFFAMNRTDFIKLGGFNEQFQSAGGGLVNHDFLQRAVSRDDTEFAVLLGEGSFHQFHGGIATNCKLEEHPWKVFSNEYKSIYGVTFDLLVQPRFGRVHYLGSMPKAGFRFVTSDVSG